MQYARTGRHKGTEQKLKSNYPHVPLPEQGADGWRITQHDSRLRIKTQNKKSNKSMDAITEYYAVAVKMLFGQGVLISTARF